ncbi:MAG TPA: GNAT family N-acetyltransferase [Acidimicrobiia bacterium]|nr:GNAT family N-acetyltransferase [Acidimicrobiia bacterium]
MQSRFPERIETERLVLRLWTEADVPGMIAAVAASLDHLRPWMPWVAGEPETVEQKTERVVRWRKAWGDGEDLTMGVFLGGEPIGGTGLHSRVGEDALEIGYWIHADHTGKGYATELTRALTDVAFEIEGVERVEIHHDKANISSGRVPERLGFTLAEEKSRDPEAPGEMGVERIWVMTRAEWRRAHGQRVTGNG